MREREREEEKWQGEGVGGGGGVSKREWSGVMREYRVSKKGE